MEIVSLRRHLSVPRATGDYTRSANISPPPPPLKVKSHRLHFIDSRRDEIQLRLRHFERCHRSVILLLTDDERDFFFPSQLHAIVARGEWKIT